MKVELASYQGEMCIIKSFNKDKVMQNQNRIEEVMFERELLKTLNFDNIN